MKQMRAAGPEELRVLHLDTAERVGPAGASLRRHNEGVLQCLERPALRWLATSLPGWVTPDMLTGLGFLGAVIAAAGYALSSYGSWMLWIASFGIVVNWFGDSLDGNVARARGIERPAYGFFLDNATDALEYAIFAAGIGLSGYVRWDLTLATLAAFYLMMLLGLIKSQAMNIFQISFGGMGLTEVRGAFIVFSTALYFVPPVPFRLFDRVMTYPNLLSAAWLAVQLLTFLVVAFKTLRQLAAVDPPRHRR